jgi:hypothetical protein
MKKNTETKTDSIPMPELRLGLHVFFFCSLGAGKVASEALRTPLFLSCDTVLPQQRNNLAIETGLGEKFLRDFLSHPPKWLKSAYYGGEGWELRLNITNRAFRALGTL